jgi:general secretion pathway protein D
VNLLRAAAVALALVTLAGCGASRAYSRGERAARAGDWDTAVSYYTQAFQANPRRTEYRIALERAQLAASLDHLDRARAFDEKGELEAAIREYRRAAEFDTTNARAGARAIELERVLRDKLEAARPVPPIQQLREQVRQQQETVLNPASREPIRAKFVSGIQLSEVLNFVGQASGINILYERDFADRRLQNPIELDGVTVEQALNLVLTSNGFFYKVQNPRTIMVIPDQPQKRAAYEEQVIQVFHVSNADVTELQTLLTGLFQGTGVTARPLVTANKTANTITMRGSAPMVAIAERVIQANDKPRAEVVIDIEILEVNRSRAKAYGLNLSQYSISGVFSPESVPGATGTGTGGTGTANTSGLFNLNSISQGINTADFYVGVPSWIIRFLESDSSSKLIAKPSLRGQEGKTLTANLGDEIPVPSTTFTPLIGGGTAVNPLTSFQYRPVGVNVEVTPRVTYTNDIILDLTVESSTKGSDVNIAGQALPSFGSRRVKTTMRLRDGESNLLAGLLRDDERRSLSGFPGAIHVPILKQLFSSNDNQIAQTDIVMLLTPRIIRTHQLTAEDVAPIYIGTAQNPSLGGGPPPLIQPSGDAGQPAIQPPAAAPAAAPGTAVGRPTPQGTPVLPPGSSPIPGTVMQPPAAPPVAPPVAQPEAALEPAPAAPPEAAAQPSAAGQAGVAQVTVAPPSTEFRVGGGPYTVPLLVNGISRVSTVSLTLTFDPAILRVRSVQEGSFMRQGNVTVAFAQQVDSASGRVDITLSRAGDVVGATGSGLLAAVLLESIAPGATALTPAGVASGPGGQIRLDFVPAAVTVK